MTLRYLDHDGHAAIMDTELWEAWYQRSDNGKWQSLHMADAMCKSYCLDQDSFEVMFDGAPRSKLHVERPAPRPTARAARQRGWGEGFIIGGEHVYRQATGEHRE